MRSDADIQQGKSSVFRLTGMKSSDMLDVCSCRESPVCSH